MAPKSPKDPSRKTRRSPGSAAQANAEAQTTSLASRRARKAGWTFEDSYNRRHFYTNSTDINGHHASAKISLSPLIHGQMAELVASRQFPQLRTIGDIVRDAIVHRLYDYADMLGDGDLRGALSNVILEQNLERYRDLKAQHRRIIEHIETITLTAAELAQIERIAEDLPDDTRPEILRAITKARAQLRPDS